MSVFNSGSKSLKPPLSVWYARCSTLTAFGLVVNRGLLKREFLHDNIDLLSVREGTTTEVRHGHLDHSLPFLIREADAATALWAYGQNGRSRLLALGATYHAISIVVPQNSHIRSLADLNGRRLSLPREAGIFSPARVRTLRAWESILHYAGLERHQVEFVPVIADHPSVPFGDVARRETEALLGGETEAAIVYGAKGLELIQSTHLRLVHQFSAQDIYEDPRLSGLIEQRALSVDSQLIEHQADALQRVLRHVFRAADWARHFPREALSQIAYEGKVGIEAARLAYGDLVAEGAALGLEPARIEKLERLRHWLGQGGYLSPDLNLHDWIKAKILDNHRDYVPQKVIA